jgi:hypothetical protein
MTIVTSSVQPLATGCFIGTKWVVHSNVSGSELDLPPRAKPMHPVFHTSVLYPFVKSSAYQPPSLPVSIE